MNRKKTLFSVIFGVLGGVSFCISTFGLTLYGSFSTFILFFFIAVIMLVVSKLVYESSMPDFKEKVTEEVLLKRQKAAEEQKVLEQKRIDKVLSKMQEFNDSFGELSKDIVIRKFYGESYIYDTSDRVLIYESSSKIIIRNRIFNFEDIIAFNLVDDEEIIYQNSVSTSKSETSAGSMIGRALVGGALLGGVGAIIGGATAKKNIITTNTPQPKSVIHNYKVNIIVNSISNPQIIINLDNYKDMAGTLVAILSVIVERNKNKSVLSET